MDDSYLSNPQNSINFLKSKKNRHSESERRRHLRTAGELGTRLSLARVLARVGGHKASILPLQQATTRNIDAREHVMEAALAPTINGVTPF